MESVKGDINNKFKFLFTLVGWIIAFILVLAVSLPGIIIAYQYVSDDCVKGIKYNELVDMWLLFGCASLIATMVVILGKFHLSSNYKKLTLS